MAIEWNEDNGITVDDITNERISACRQGCGRTSDHDLAKYMIIAALDRRRVIGEDVAAMMSEAAARLNVDGWNDGREQYFSG